MRQLDGAASPMFCLQIVKDRNVRGPADAEPDEPESRVVRRHLVALPPLNTPMDDATIPDHPGKTAFPNLKHTPQSLQSTIISVLNKKIIYLKINISLEKYIRNRTGNMGT